MTDDQVVVAVVILAGFFATLAGLVVALNLVIIDVRDRLARRRSIQR